MTGSLNAKALEALLAERIGQDFTGECHLTEDEARQIIAVLSALPQAGTVSEEMLTVIRQHVLVEAGDDELRAALEAAPSLRQQEEAASFQDRVQPWMMACFGPEISADRVERGDRFLEEVFELLQSGDYDPARVLPLRDYVWGREIGEPSQEAGGVMVTLAAYCLAHDLDMHAAGESELARIWTKVEKIRAKQAAKPTGSALPVASPVPADAGAQVAVERIECVSYDTGYEMPADPIWRIEIDGYCADFEFETAARNFAAAINSRFVLVPADAGEPSIKALEWNPFRAETPFGYYHIDDQTDRTPEELKGRAPFLLSGSRVDLSRHLTLEEARAAAQAHFDARIRSALVPATSHAKGSSPADMVDLHIVFQDDGGPANLRFVEIENLAGKSVRAGTWFKRDDGYDVLSLSVHPSNITSNGA